MSDDWKEEPVAQGGDTEETVKEPDGSSGVVPIKSVERAAALLGLFSANETKLTLGEIARRLSMSRATAHRYCVSLRGTGLLHYDRSSNIYSLGPHIIELGTAAVHGLDILRVAGPYLERLVSLTNVTAVMSIWDGEAPVVVRVYEATNQLVTLSVRVGSRLPVFSSAQGRIYLAFSTGARRAHRSNPELERLEPELREIRQTGVAANAGVIPGVGVVAAPVFQGNEVAGTLALVGIADSIPEDPNSELASRLRDIAAQLSGVLGHDNSNFEGKIHPPQRGGQLTG
jgi:DNA-binding IclR family transcriptional regulator